MRLPCLIFLILRTHVQFRRPYFHWPTYQDQVRRHLYRTDWGVFMVTMAACALAAGRLSDGVPMPPCPDLLRSEAAHFFPRNAALPR